MTRIAAFPILAVACLAVLALGGCGGTIDDDNGLDLGQPGYPVYKDLTLVLRVQDPFGAPVGDATVTVDGMADLTTTDDTYHRLDATYPREWVGWRANWVSDFYQVVMNYAGDVDEFIISVTKDGWTTDRTLVQIFDYEPDHIYIRGVLTIAPLAEPYAVSAAASHAAEVTGGAAPAATPAGPRIIIRSTDD